MRALVVLTIGAFLTGCAAQTKPTPSTTWSTALLPRSTVRKVERVIDAIAGSERSFKRKVEIEGGESARAGGESELTQLYRALAPYRAHLSQTKVILVQDWPKLHTYAWKATEHRLVPIETKDWKLTASVTRTQSATYLWNAKEHRLVLSEGAKQGTWIEVTDWTHGIYEFGVRDDRPKLSYAGATVVDPPAPPSLRERIWHPSLR